MGSRAEGYGLGTDRARAKGKRINKQIKSEACLCKRRYHVKSKHAYYKTHDGG